MLGLYNLVKFGGAPLAEDRGDTTVIHDDPRKAAHKPAMYDTHIQDILRTGVSRPFHTYQLDDQGVRRFVHYKKIPVSVRSRSNNCIIPDAKGYPIDGDRINIIIASSASGKTAFIKEHPEFVDGDDLLKWPSDTDWVYETSSRAAVNVGLWQQLASQNADSVILYAGDVSVIPKYLERRFRFVALVHISDARHKANILEGIKSGSSQPTDWELISAHRKELFDWAITKEIPVVSGFRQARDLIVRTGRRAVDAALSQGKNRLNITRTMIRLIAPTGVYTHLDSGDRMTFGSHVSMRIHTNEYARASGLTQHRWKHLTRMLPLFYIMCILGYKVQLRTTPCGHISDVMYKGNVINASGHMLGMFTWIAFPDARPSGMPSLYPDMHTYLVMYMLNQTAPTPTLEQHTRRVAYHRWIETYAGIVGSYFAIKILLKTGLSMRRRDALLWFLYARRAVRMIRITQRNTYMDVEYNRSEDTRFGPLTV